MSDSQDGTPTGDPPDGTAVTSQIHTINISCAGCNEAYSVSDDDGLAGMSFPCDNCGTMVEVPEMPWVDQGGTTFETTSPPIGMEFDQIPEEKAFDGGTAINVTCFSCLEEYNVSADDGLAGMDFPCDNCGVDVKVPDHPWPEPEATEPAEDDDFFNVGTPLSEEELAEREDQGHQQMSEGDLEGLPIQNEGPTIEGGTEITVMCFSCLEEYNVSADDGLAGIEFPCSNCGADVQVPDHPWPETEPEPDYDDDFFNVGTPLSEEEQAARDDAKKIEDENLAQESREADDALAAKRQEAKSQPKAEPTPEKAPEKKPDKTPDKKAKKAPEKKKPKEKKPKKKAKPEPEPKQDSAPEPEQEPAPRAEPPRSEPGRPMASAPRSSSEAPKSPAGSQGGPRRPSVVSGGGRKLHARTRDPEATDTGPEVTVVHEKGPAAPRPPDSVATVAAPVPRVPAPRAPMPAPAKAPERKRFREPDRPRLDMGSGGISAPSGNYAGGGGGSGPEEVTVTLKRGGRADTGPEPTQPTVEIQRGRNTGGARAPQRPAPKSKGPIVVRVVSPFFSGMKKLFSRGSDTPESQPAPIEQASPASAQAHFDNGSNVSPQEQARRRQVQIIHEQREDIRRGVGVRDTPGDEDFEKSEDGDSVVDKDEEAQKRKIRNIKLAVLTGLVIAPFVIWSDVLFAPLLGDKARPETDKKFWENREVGQEEESNQPTVDLSEMLGAQEEAKNAEVKPISADNVDTLGYRNLRNQVDLLSVQGLQANKSLLLWAQFRLASAYKDPVARKKLIANAPKRLNSEEYGPMGLAAAAGALVLQGKGGKARKLINRLTVSEGKESPQMLLVLAMSQKPRGNMDKVVAMLDDALAKNPSMMDARFARASILSSRTEKGEDWAPELVDAILESKDPDNAVRGGQLLLQQELFAEQARMFEPFKSVPALDAMSPDRRDTFIKMLTGAHLHKADFASAYLASRARLEGKTSASAVVEASRLAEASGKAPIPVLDKNSGMLGGGSDTGRIALEKIRVLLKSGDLKAAQAAYGKVKSRPGVRGTPWMHLMDAEIAVANGKTGQAKKSLKRATKGRSKNPHALYARETLLQATPTLGRLEQLRKKLKTPRLQLDLAKAQAQNGKLSEAEANYESLLWSHPGATDPVETVLGWIDLIDRKGESDMARTLAESVQSSRPYDLRPVNQLVELADRNNDEEGAATWVTAKIRLKKKVRELKDGKSANPDGTDQGTPKADPAAATGTPATPTGRGAGQPDGGTVP